MPVVAADLRHAEVVLRGLAAAKGSNAVQTVNLFHFRRLSTIVDVNKLNIITAFLTGIVAPIAALLNESWTGYQVDVRMLEDVTDPYLSAGTAAVGAITGDRISTEVSAYLLLRTPYRGRSYRGSKHLGPMSESDSTAATADLWNAGALTRLHDVADAIMAGLNTAEGNVWVPVIWSRRQSDMTTIPATIRSYDLSQILVNKRQGRMKRRQVKSVF